MTPYESPFYFIILTIALLPLIILHLLGKKAMWYQVIISFALLWLSFGGASYRHGLSLIGFGLYQVLLIKGYEAYRVRLKKNSFAIFVLALLASIFPIFMVKLMPAVWGKPSIFGFLGISYITFKVVNVILELRDGLIKDVPLFKFIYFLYFYPTISSGPIDRFRRFRKELESPLTSDYPTYLSKGIHMIFVGFLYKFIIAHLIDMYALHELAQKATSSPTFYKLLGVMYCYGFYLFFDFAGYSLFAIGVSYIMGYEIPINFNKPFLSRNMKEFWNRWHMSLSFWFRDNVYMRLVYFLVKKKLIKNKNTISNISYFALFGLMGLWHGFTWYYIVYGLFHASLMCLTDMWERWKKKHKGLIPNNKAIDVLNMVLTTHAVLFSFLIFSGIFNYILMYPKAHILPNF